jgi:thiosulfate/3-mercaptopyruvate sulfurtransferase
MPQTFPSKEIFINSMRKLQI